MKKSENVRLQVSDLSKNPKETMSDPNCHRTKFQSDWTKTKKQHCYIIPHPTIYPLAEFEANWLKNDRVIEWAPF